MLVLQLPSLWPDGRDIIFALQSSWYRVQAAHSAEKLKRLGSSIASVHVRLFSAYMHFMVTNIGTSITDIPVIYIL